MATQGQESQTRRIVRNVVPRTDSIPENVSQNEVVPYGVNLDLPNSKLICPGIVFAYFIFSGVYTLFILGIGLIQPCESMSVNGISDILTCIVIWFPKYKSRAQEVLQTVFFLMPEGEKDKKEDKKEQPKSSIRPKLQQASQVLFSMTTIMFFTRLFLDYFGFVPENEILVNIIDFYPKSCMLMHLSVVIREFFDVLQIPYNDFLLNGLLSFSTWAGPFIWIKLAGNPTRAERQHGNTIFYLMLVLFIFYLLVWSYDDKEEDTRMRTFLYRVRGKAKMVTDTFQVVVEPVYKASPDWLKRLGHGSWYSLKRFLTDTTNMLNGTIQTAFTPKGKQPVRVTSISLGGIPKTPLESKNNPERNPKESVFKKVVKFEDKQPVQVTSISAGEIQKTPLESKRNPERNPKESVFKKVVKFLSPFCQKVPYASFGAVILYILCYGSIFVMRHIRKLE